MFISFNTLLAAATLAASGAFAAEFIVIDPKITSPTTHSVWKVGSVQNVTWDTSSIPASSANQTGMILLGFDSKGSENLNISSPLATQFPIGAGSVLVTTPDVTPGNDYIVVLFGDSGNVSPEFKITA